MMMKTIIAAVVSVFLYTTQIAAQESKTATKKESEMSVDMPDETEETDLVEKGKIQLETSVLYNRYKNYPGSLIGQGLLRYGMAKRIELRVLVEDGRERDQYISETVQAIYPLAIGTKISLLKDVNGIPDVTFIAYMKLPFTSHNKEQKRYWSPSFLLAFQHKFGDKFELEYNAGVQQDAFDSEWEFLANAALHYKITDNLEIAAEYYARYQGGEEPSHNIGGSLAYEIGDNIEVYISGGSTIRYTDQNNYFNAGIAFRLP